MILRAGGKLLAFALSRLGTHQSETKIRGFSVYKIVRYVRYTMTRAMKNFDRSIKRLFLCFKCTLCVDVMIMQGFNSLCRENVQSASCKFLLFTNNSV